MDPLTAVGLASNVLSFIHFAGKIVGLGREIAESSQGTTVGYHDLTATTVNLEKFCRRLTAIPTVPGKAATGISETDRSIEDIASASLDIANDLIDSLRNVQVKSSSGGFKSILYALRSVMQESKIVSLRDRLERYHGNLQTALLLSLREKWDENPPLSSSLPSPSAAMLDRMKADILSEIQTLGGAQKADSVTLQRSLAQRLSAMSRHQIDADHTAGLVEQLAFEDQDDRAYRIPEAHETTFKWILAPSEAAQIAQEHRKWDDFLTWLRGESHLYWITGKAGSGKSTLMKYITAQPECTSQLKHWAGGLPLVVTSFYFWNSGSEHQQSQEGLLRSILYQALSQLPELAPSVFPKRWARSEMFGSDTRALKMPELSRAFHNLIRQAKEHPFKLCMFVDGLDEFEGDQNALVSLFREAVAGDNVKACLSSRPWNVFEVALSKMPNLMLQNLTYPDIVQFISTSFKSDPGFQALAYREPTFASTLIGNVAEKACGVFLWVDLVVKSLLDGMANYDRISDLQQRLDEIPADIEEFYRKILDSIEDRYTTSAYRFLRLTRAAHGKLTALWLSFADEEPAKVHRAALALPIAPLSHEEAVHRYWSAKRRLNSTCKGFLELASVGHSPEEDIWSELEATVSYHHRTAKDFLESSEVETRILTSTPDFEPTLVLTASAVSAMKCAQDSIPTRAKERNFDKTMDLAASFETPNHLLYQLLDEAQRYAIVADLRFENFQCLTQQHIRLNCSNCGTEGTLVPRVAGFALQPYVCAKILQSCCAHPDLSHTKQCTISDLLYISLQHFPIFVAFKSKDCPPSCDIPDLSIIRHLLQQANKSKIMESEPGEAPPFELVMKHAQDAQPAVLRHWADLAAACIEASSASAMPRKRVLEYMLNVRSRFGPSMPDRSEQLIMALSKMEKPGPKRRPSTETPKSFPKLPLMKKRGKGKGRHRAAPVDGLGIT